MTRQRQVILEAIKKVCTHPTADKVYEMTRELLPKISLGTVYRNLEMLSQHGLIQKIEIGSTQKRFDGNVDSHCHVRCISCGCVDDVMIDPLITIGKDLGRLSKYKIIGHRVEFIGVCPRCKNKRPDAQQTIRKGG
jgi:Fur family ferric uptake transcriptional regulator